MADLVIDTGYKKRFAKESLLSLPELMLRWPFQCFLKIHFELFNKRLIPYFLLENHTSTNGEQIVQVCKTIDGHFSLSFIISFFGSFVFKIKNIESIEKQKRHYSDIPEKSLMMRKFDLCTPQNINELAIPFSYIMSKYGNKFYFNNFVPYNVEHDFFSGTFDTSFSYAFDKIELPHHIDDSIIWAEYKSSITKSKRNKDNLDYYRKELERYKNNGEKDPYRLARKIQNFSGNSLTNEDIGRLLPVRPGAHIEPKSFKKRGQRLLAIMK